MHMTSCPSTSHHCKSTRVLALTQTPALVLALALVLARTPELALALTEELVLELELRSRLPPRPL